MKCYICDNEATSSEHCPPQSFFPSDKRVNLITVPSCAIHNEQTSLDDEYVRNVIAMTKGNNGVGANQFKNKGRRSLERSAALSRITFKNPKSLNFIDGDDNSKAMALEVDRKRFDKVIRKIAYGLFYFTFHETWSYELSIATHNLITDELKPDPIAERIRYHNKLGAEFSYQGSNLDVFKYSFLHFTFSRHKFLVMKFYDWFEVWAIPRDSSTKPSLEE